MQWINTRKKIIVVKAFKGKGPKKCFDHFWFLNYYLRWFVLVPAKDRFAHA
jgi:hypothetical protein